MDIWQAATETTHLLHCIRRQYLIFKAIMAVEAGVEVSMVLEEAVVTPELVAHSEEAQIVTEFPRQRKVRAGVEEGSQLIVSVEMVEMGEMAS
jgi:hypothetical protein